MASKISFLNSESFPSLRAPYTLTTLTKRQKKHLNNYIDSNLKEPTGPKEINLELSEIENLLYIACSNKTDIFSQLLFDNEEKTPSIKSILARIIFLDFTSTLEFETQLLQIQEFTELIKRNAITEKFIEKLLKNRIAPAISDKPKQLDIRKRVVDLFGSLIQRNALDILNSPISSLREVFDKISEILETYDLSEFKRNLEKLQLKLELLQQSLNKTTYFQNKSLALQKTIKENPIKLQNDLKYLTENIDNKQIFNHNTWPGLVIPISRRLNTFISILTQHIGKFSQNLLNSFISFSSETIDFVKSVEKNEKTFKMILPTRKEIEESNKAFREIYKQEATIARIEFLEKKPSPTPKNANETTILKKEDEKIEDLPKTPQLEENLEFLEELRTALLPSSNKTLTSLLKTPLDHFSIQSQKLFSRTDSSVIQEITEHTFLAAQAIELFMTHTSSGSTSEVAYIFFLLDVYVALEQLLTAKLIEEETEPTTEHRLKALSSQLNEKISGDLAVLINSFNEALLSVRYPSTYTNNLVHLNKTVSTDDFKFCVKSFSLLISVLLNKKIELEIPEIDLKVPKGKKRKQH